MSKGFDCIISNMKLIFAKKKSKALIDYNTQSFIRGASLKFGSATTIKLGKDLHMKRGCKLYVRGNANVVIGNNVFFNYNCMVVARNNIIIGDGTIHGPNVSYFDHDHVFKRDDLKAGKEFICGDINIGKNVWIGANCIILRDTVIGDNSVIAAGTVVKGHSPANSIIYTKRELVAKPIE